MWYPRRRVIFEAGISPPANLERNLQHMFLSQENVTILFSKQNFSHEKSFLVSSVRKFDSN